MLSFKKTDFSVHHKINNLKQFNNLLYTMEK